MVDIAVRLAHASQRQARDTGERARGVDQIGDLPEPARVSLPLEAASSREFIVCGGVLPRSHGELRVKV